MNTDFEDGVIVNHETVKAVGDEIATWVDHQTVTLQLWSEKQQDWISQQHGESPHFRLMADNVVVLRDSLMIAECWPIPTGCLVYIKGDTMILLTQADRLVRFIRQ